MSREEIAQAAIAGRGECPSGGLGGLWTSNRLGGSTDRRERRQPSSGSRQRRSVSTEQEKPRSLWRNGCTQVRVRVCETESQGGKVAKQTQ